MRLKRNYGVVSITLIIYALIAAAAVGVVGYAYYLGGSHKEAKMEAAYAAERLKRIDMISELAVELGTRAVTRHEENRKVINELQRIEDTWKGVVNRYVPKDPSRNCPVTTGWVQYHDERAAGLPAGPGPVAGTAGRASGIEEATALETVGDNYALYPKCKARLRQVLTEFDDIRRTMNEKIRRMNNETKNGPDR